MADYLSPKIRFEILDKIAALITAAFGLVAALAWNDLITRLFAQVFGKSDAIIPMIIYALIVTIIAVILTMIVGKAASKAKSIIHQKTFQCSLCTFQTKIESEFLEHNVKQHAANQDKFFYEIISKKILMVYPKQTIVKPRLKLQMMP